MSELSQFLIVAAFGAICFGCGYLIAFIVTRNKWRDAIVGDELNVQLGRQIIHFHQSQRIQPRYGRTLTTNRGKLYRWCFSDLLIARAFIEQFGGELYKHGIK